MRSLPVKIVLSLLAILVAALGLALYITPAALFPDPSWGFQVMRSMELGSNFNTLVKSAQADISKNTVDFLTWWSPGQYLIPYLLKTLLKVNTGQSAAIVTLLCQLLGLAGLYAFMKKAGFSVWIATISLVIVTCQQAFFSPFIFYSGGEVLLFAFIGWFLYGCLSADRPGIKLVLFVLLSGWIGFICKSSFIWMYAAGLLFIWIKLSSQQKTISGWFLKGLWPGIPAAVSVACIYVFYLSKGANPSSDSGSLKLGWETFSFPLASPLLSGLSADDLCNGLIFHNDQILFTHPQAILLLLLLALLSIALIWAILTFVPLKEYRLMLIIFYGVSVVFFSYAFLRQMAISYEARHFRTIGLLIIPGTVSLVSSGKPVFKWLLGAITLFILTFSIKFYTEGYRRLKDENVHGPSGFAQQFIDRESLGYITKLDKQYHNATFVFTSPDLGLEVVNNRIITLQPLNGDISIDFEQYVHRGYSGPLFILLPSRYIGIRASVFMKCFPGYKSFSLKELSDDYTLYYSNTRR